MDQAPDYYVLLHVHPDAPLEVIKASYRTLMQQLKAHPDLGGDHAQAALLNEAYDTLKNPKRRAAYDAQRQGAPADEAPEANRSMGPNARHGRPQRAQRSPTCVFCGSERGDGADCKSCGAPTSPREREADAGERALDRLNRRQAVSFHTSWPSKPQLGQTRDISIHGMLIESRVALAFDQIVKLECEVCRAVARVAHVHRDGLTHVAGLEFLTVSFTRTKGAFITARV